MFESHAAITVVAALIISPMLASATAADATQTAQAWYQDSYAPLWADSPGDNIDAIVAHYQSSITSYNNDGSISTDDSATWIGAPIKQWVVEGWLKSELVTLRTDVINDSTATFKAKWKDSYKGAKPDYACGWYMANKFDGSWRFTAYADLDCAQLQ